MSPRTGRPKAEDPVKAQLTVRLHQATMDALADYCERKHISKGEAVRRGVEKLLAEE